MNLAAVLDLYAGGPGSGCHGENCGRPRQDYGNVRAATKPVGHYRQPTNDSCGPTALANLAAAFGGRDTPETLMAVSVFKTQLDRGNGVTLDAVAKVAQAIKVPLEGYEIDKESTGELPVPCLAVINHNQGIGIDHLIVIRKIEDGHVHIKDSAASFYDKSKFTIADFNKIFTGEVMIPQKKAGKK